MTTISIIGSGNMAAAIGTRAAKHGHTIELMSRNTAKAQALAARIGNTVHPIRRDLAPAAQLEPAGKILAVTREPKHEPLAAAEVLLETDRLLLRRWRVSDAALQRALWVERDPRVPPHRRIGPDGHPTIEDLEDRIRRESADASDASLGLLAAERRGCGDVIGYCGLIPNVHGQDGEPELAYEFLRTIWGQGYATEAGRAVLGWAAESGYRRLWATVRDWNAASRRVMDKLGFVETVRVEPDAIHGDSLFYVKDF